MKTKKWKETKKKRKNDSSSRSRITEVALNVYPTEVQMPMGFNPPTHLNPFKHYRISENESCHKKEREVSPLREMHQQTRKALRVFRPQKMHATIH